MNFGKLLKAASHLAALLHRVFAYPFEALEQALRPLRLNNLLADRLDQITAGA